MTLIYGEQTTANSHARNIESTQSIILRTIINTPWYIRNEELPKDLGIPTVKEEIERYSGKYKIKVDNQMSYSMIQYKISIPRRLHKTHPIDLLMKK